MGKFWNGYAWREHFEPTPKQKREVFNYRNADGSLKPLRDPAEVFRPMTDGFDVGPATLIGLPPVLVGSRRISKVNELAHDTLIVEGEMVFSSREVLEGVREGQRLLNEAGKELFEKYGAISVGRTCDVEEIEGKLVQTNLGKPTYDVVEEDPSDE